jgi:hypothetical protein
VLVPFTVKWSLLRVCGNAASRVSSIFLFKTGEDDDGVIVFNAMIEFFIFIVGAPPSLVTALSLILKSRVRV